MPEDRKMVKVRIRRDFGPHAYREDRDAPGDALGPLVTKTWKDDPFNVEEATYQRLRSKFVRAGSREDREDQGDDDDDGDELAAPMAPVAKGSPGTGAAAAGKPGAKPTK